MIFHYYLFNITIFVSLYQGVYEKYIVYILIKYIKLYKYIVPKI